MALVPFSYANPFTDQLRLSERLFTIDGKLIRIQQAWKAGGKGGTEIGFGASVYPAAFVLADFLERHPYLVRGKRVIELGTGTGFLGIAAAAIGAAEVCLTDGDDISLELAQKNVSANLPSMKHPAKHPGANVSISTRRLRWGCSSDMEALVAAISSSHSRGEGGDGDEPSWDVILGSDIAAFPYASAYEGLLRTIVSLATTHRGLRSSTATNGTSGGGHAFDETRNESSSSISADLQSCAGKACENEDGNIGGAAEPCDESERGEDVLRVGEGELKFATSRGKSAGQVAANKRAKVLVLLAHKRRHDSEDTFFEAASERLGESSDLGDQNLHPDFRGSGIRLHMFTVH